MKLVIFFLISSSVAVFGCIPLIQSDQSHDLGHGRDDHQDDHRHNNSCHDDHDEPDGERFPDRDPCHENCARWCADHVHVEEDFHHHHYVANSSCHCPGRCFCEFGVTDENDSQDHCVHEHHIIISFPDDFGSNHEEFCGQ